METAGTKKDRKKAGRKKTTRQQSPKSRPVEEVTSAPETHEESCVVVGIGASAGGLGALRLLLEAMPEEPDVAIVVIQHLDPEKKSLAPEILSKYTRLPVREAENGQAVKVNCVYVIPPGKYVSISGGELQLSAIKKTPGSRMAVDYFFRSLSKDRRHRGIAVILSGTGSDGMLGAKAIKSVGGMVIAQQPKTADFDGMPSSSINAGLVDHILAPQEIPEALVRYARHPYVRENLGHAVVLDNEEQTVESKEADDVQTVVHLLQAHLKHDFRNYKEKTLVRRTRRRMCLHHIDEYEEYLNYLRKHPEEMTLLATDLLISVTDFFRDSDAWEELLRKAVRPIVKEKESDQPIRVWSSGCATGEEPYSLAMLFLEELRRAGKNCPLQIFASDVSKDALEQARAGRYPKSIQADVSAERLKRFFVLHDGDDYYHVSKMLRDSVVFAEQNLISDPPFSKLDLVCCRNLLIYLKADIQEKIVSMFHFALRKGGILFLGSAETVGRHTNLFETLDKRWRIFRHIGSTPRERFEIPLAKADDSRNIGSPSSTSALRDIRLTHVVQQQLLELLAPAAVLVDPQWRILFICGDVDPYLLHRPGTPNNDLLEKLRPGLRSKIRFAVREALSKNRNVSVTARAQRESGYYPVHISVRVIHNRGNDGGLALVLFEDSGEERPAAEDAPEAAEESSALSGPNKDGRNSGSLPEDDYDEHTVIRQLEEELSRCREELQTALEQLETSGEEHKASHEEVMSVNEELQSTNEELETSKEELQSLNEELSTVNSQLAEKVGELESKHSDLENLLAATDVATICLNTDLAVRWFTPAAQQIVRLKSGDMDRPLADLATDFRENDLVKISDRVLKNLTPVEDEALCTDGRTYLRRIMPYRSDPNRIGGLVITFIDLTRRKAGERAVQQSKELLEKILYTIRETTLVLDADLKVLRADPAYYDRFDTSPDKTLGHPIYHLGKGQWDIPELRKTLQEILPKNRVLKDFVTDQQFPKIGRRVMLLNARRLEKSRQILVAIEDITDQHLSADALRESEARYRTLVETSAEIVWTADARGRMAEDSPSWRKFTGQTFEEGKGMGWLNAIHSHDRKAVKRLWQEAVSSKTPFHVEYRLTDGSGQYRWTVVRASPQMEADGSVRRWIGMNFDITQRKEAELQLRELNESLEEQVRQRTEALALRRKIAEKCHAVSTFHAAVHYALREITHFNGWCFGQAFELDPDHPGRMVHTDQSYESAPGRFKKFLKETRSLPVIKGRNLPGRVWKNRKAAFTTDPKQLRSRPGLADHGEISTAAFPVTLGNEVIAVLEFFSDEPMHSPERNIEMMNDISAQLSRVEERTRAHEAVKQSERRMRRVVESNIAGVFIADSKGNIREANPAFRTLLGYRKNEFAKGTVNWTQTLPQKDGKSGSKAQILKEIQRDGGCSGREMELVRKDGSRMATLFGMSPLQNASGKNEDYVGFVLDVSGLRDLQRQILEISDYERQRIGQDLHDSLGQEITALKLQMSHFVRDLRGTSAGSDRTAVELLELIARIEENTHSLAHGLIPLRRQPGGLDLALEEMTALMSNLYQQDCVFRKTQSVKIQNPVVAMHLYRIASEAVVNAMKHSGARKIIVSLSEKKGRLRLEIRDNGKGMPEHNRRRQHRLGLDIMDYRARLIDAEISITSEKGKGTTVTCTVANLPGDKKR